MSRGEADGGFWRAVMRSKAVLVVASVGDVRSIIKLGRENSTITKSRYTTCNSDSVTVMDLYTTCVYHVVIKKHVY